MNTKVSIIVPCYKQAHFLKDSLQSVLDQSYPYWECIIVNDGSPDNTAAIAKQWTTRDSRILYVEKENGGLSSARNFGIKQSKGEYIVALDADDILHKDYLIKLVPELENDPSLAIVSSYREFFRENKENVFFKEKAKGTNYRDFMFENILMPSSMYRKKYWNEVGGYDENMKKGFEDWDFWLSITKNGRKFKFVQEYLFYYRKSKNSMLIDTLKNHRIDVMQYVFEKHKEIYVKHYDNTLEYLFFLINLHRNTEIKIKKSIEYKIAKAICKPYRMLKKMWRKK
ncbi:glycosyltransferase family A protein [Flavobacterium sp.]|uniref:glycosyltransferase family 2 protein n=1 Tax=Flavobacterium sp. TaxID=239 RepID=UPI0031CFB4A0